MWPTYVEVSMFSPTHFWVSTVEVHHGKSWNHDITMNLGFDEAVEKGQQRANFLNLPFHNRVTRT